MIGFRTLDGRAIEVLHPGFWNRESGPDFRGAVLRVGDKPPAVADVEVDLRSSGWHGHGHDANPNYSHVALHVIWEGDGQPKLPTLALKPVLDAPIQELGIWLGSEAAIAFPIELLGQCCAPLRGLTEGRLTHLLHEAAFVRLQAKAAWLQARARQAGWEQALWEGLFRALGYKRNIWPMQRLAELRGRLHPDGAKIDRTTSQARLLGVGGLLPDDVTSLKSRRNRYVRELWDSWWRERETFGDCVLPRSLWRFDHIRPANHPQRRLALASHWLRKDGLAPRLEAWCLPQNPPSSCVAALAQVLSVPSDEFWSWHWTLGSERLPEARPLLGPTRITDLAINVILPWLWTRATEGRNEPLRHEIERRYFAWPCAEDNAVLRLARQRLLGDASKRVLRNAAMQQGLLQVVKDFCEQSDAICRECRFPKLVENWSD